MDTPTLARNITALETRYPDLAREIYPLAIAAKPFTPGELDRPIEISKIWIKNCMPDRTDMLMCNGIAHGHGLNLLSSLIRPEAKLFAAESDSSKFARLLPETDITAPLLAENVTIFIGPSAVKDARDFSFIARFKAKIEKLSQGSDLGDEFTFSVFPLEPLTDDDEQTSIALIDTETEAIARNELDIYKYGQVYHAAGELAEFTGENRIILSRDIMNITQRIAADWYEHSPAGEEQIHNWYIETPYYLHDLCKYHATSNSYRTLSQAVEKICGSHGGEILDFGGGDGDMTLRLVDNGHKVTFCDVPGRTMQYALWRFKKRNLDIPILVSDKPDTVHIDKNYDIILALDVLEHLVDPLKYCKIFHDSLNPGGILIARPSFSDHNPDFPMHLQENAYLDEIFDAEMQKINFIKQPEENEHITVWLKA